MSDKKSCNDGRWFVLLLLLIIAAGMAPIVLFPTKVSSCVYTPVNSVVTTSTSDSKTCGCAYDCGYKQIWANSVNSGSLDITVYDRNFEKYVCDFNVCLNLPPFKCYDAFVFVDHEGNHRIADITPVTDEKDMGDQCTEAMKAYGR
jgi:hypothetical protein